MAVVELETSDIKWSKSDYKLKFLLDNPNFEFPRIARVVQGHMLDEDDSLASGQVLILHRREDTEMLIGHDDYNKDLLVPLDSPNMVTLISHGELRDFACVEDICACTMLPKYIRIVEELELESQRYDAQTVFEVMHTVLSESGDAVGISCRVANTGDVFLPPNLKHNFAECISPESSTKRYLLRELVNAHGIPLKIKFLPLSHRKNVYGPELGVTTLMKNVVQSELVATTIIDGVHHALKFSVDLPVTMQIADIDVDDPKVFSKYLFNNDTADTKGVDNSFKTAPYSSVFSRNHILKAHSMCNILPSPPPLIQRDVCKQPVVRRETFSSTRNSPKKKRPKSLMFRKEFEKLVKTKIRFKGWKGSVFKKDRLEGRSKTEKEIESVTQIDSMLNADTKSISIDAYPCASNTKWGEHCLKITPHMKALSLNTDSYPIMRDHLSQLSSKDSGICLHRKKHSTSHSSFTNELVCSNKRERTFDSNSELNLPLHSNKCRSISRENIMSKRKPGDYLWSPNDDNNDDYINGNERNNQKSDSDYLTTTCDSYGTLDEESVISLPVSLHLIDSERDSINEIRKLSEDDVSNVLDMLCLRQFKKIFRIYQINGELLVDLEKDDLINELHLSSFQAIKIMRYIKGWRPQVDHTSCDEQSRKNSLNPRDWSINDVSMHLNAINLPDLGRFCHENQVNGALLLDIIADDALWSVRDDHNVKLSQIEVKKLIKFVVKGWRPDCSPKSRI